jgi:hypothetical protein
MLRLTTAVASAIAVSHPALAEPVRYYGEGDGHRFEYSTELRENGVIRFKGLMLDSREVFRLDVAPSGWVHGRFGDWPVSYRIDKAVRDRVAAQLRETPVTVRETAAAIPH